MTGCNWTALHFLPSHPTGNYRTYTVVGSSLVASCWEWGLLARQRKVCILVTTRKSLTTIYDGNQLLSGKALIFNFSN